MEFFLPSIMVLLLVSAIVFLVLPRFGPLVLAIISLLLLSYGIYNHYTLFENEYKKSTWQLGMVTYAPYIMIAILILMIILYLTYLIPSGSSFTESSNILNMPTSINMPPANTATNIITENANNAIRAVANIANVKVNTNNQPNIPMMEENIGTTGNNRNRNGRHIYSDV